MATALTVPKHEPKTSSLSSPRLPRRVLLQGEAPLPYNDESSFGNKPQPWSFILGGIVVVAILLILFFIYRKRIKRPPHSKGKTPPTIEHQEVIKMVFPPKQQQQPPGSMEFFSGNLPTISYFDYQTLRNATKNFCPENLLGSGGFGPVYQGKLVDGRMIAVKKLCHNKSQQGEREFLVEVKTITSIQHKNLAWKLYDKSSILDIVDPKLREHGFVEKDVMQAIHVAFLCLQPHAHLRPPMSAIVALLTFKIEMVTTPMRPAFFDRRRRKGEENHSFEATSG
ncbi:Serine-threonine/tyrosine-protein kinase, catalytic domain [Sesbania bispinosa]|nr:Serine-threonine/tyrosine-protein kinase, catalytic domain [Sesbania bispinosa]